MVYGRSLGVCGLLFVIMGSGCLTARVHPDVAVSGNWAEDPAKDRAMKAVIDERRRTLLTDRAGGDVEVFVGKIPSGLELEGGVLRVEKDAPFEILGRAMIDVGSGSAFGFADYEQPWRKPFCYWQAPLTWLTLGLWALVPLNYPCGVNSFRSKEEVLAATRNLVHELGGHVFVGDYLNASEDEAMGIIGFVVRRLEAPGSEVARNRGAGYEEM